MIAVCIQYKVPTYIFVDIRHNIMNIIMTIDVGYSDLPARSRAEKMIVLF